MTAAPPSSPSSTKAPFYAFATQETDLAVLRQFAEAHRWAATHVLQGDITSATEYLKSHPAPTLLVVEIPSAQAAPDLLSRLADVCDHDTRVIVIGTVNEYSFYCWLTEIGIFSYQLMPLKLPALEHAWGKMSQPAGGSSVEKPKGKFIGVMGARGGVGSTSISIYLAALLAEKPEHSVALVDLDPQDGSISLLLDLEPCKGMREALERPDRIDNLFIDRVMQKSEHKFSILSAEESFVEPPHINEQAASALLRELSMKFDVVILDLPRQSGPFYRECMRACDKILMVTDLSLLCLRDALRISDLFRDSLHLPAPIFVANRTGMVPKYEMPVADFDKGLNAKVEHKIPYAPDVFMTISGPLPGLKGKTPAMKALRELAAKFDKAEESSGEGKKEKKAKGWLRG